MTSELWKQLHTRALIVKDNDSNFIIEFENKIPRYITGCRCKEKWVIWRVKNPPTYGEKYFEWTVAGHNHVNKDLGKPELSVEEARKLYQ